MPVLDLSPDEVLTTTRAVRKCLDLTRPVEPALIQECLELALQAPTGANSQGWHFVVVTASEQRQALAAIYRKGWAFYLEQVMAGQFQFPGPALTDERLATITRILHSTHYLADHLHKVPVLVVPCLEGQVAASGFSAEQAGFWGSILPAIWWVCQNSTICCILSHSSSIHWPRNWTSGVFALTSCCHSSSLTGCPLMDN